MDRLSSEILLSIFKKLNSVEMVNVMPVCREWLEIIDDNRALWRSLVLPQRENGWEPAVVTLFDHKCQSTLREVSLNLRDYSENEDLVALCNLLEKSKGTLRIINIVSEDWSTRRLLSEIVWKLPAAIEFRIPNGSSSKVQVVQSSKLQEEVATDHSSKLKILTLYGIDVVPKSYSDLTANLSSLSLEEWIPSSRLRQILAEPSKTLKHLGIRVDNYAGDDEDPERLEIPLLLFPKLQVLEFQPFIFSAVQFSRWMSAPQLSSLVTNSLHTFLISTSSVSLLWIDGNESRVQDTFPKLSQLIFQPFKANSTLLRPVLEMLSQRSQNVAAKMEVDGVEMRQIQKLVLPSRYFNDKNSLEFSLMMSDLRRMVDEVVAFESESRILKVEI